jgi:hypothetical protein
MSQLEDRTLTCSTCQTPFSVQVATSLNAVRAVTAREAVLAGRLHHFACPACGQEHRVETTFGYMDVHHKHWLAVFPPDAVERWPACETAAHDAFWTVTDHAPMMWNFQAIELSVRCVFGLDGLQEKLRIWEAGLDDALVEMWKAELEHADPSLTAAPLHFVRIEADEAIFAHAGQDSLAAPLARYTVLRALRAVLQEQSPSLFRGPFVDRRRLQPLSAP